MAERLTIEQLSCKASGVPYKPFGRDYDGIDCWGVIVLAYRDVLGIELPRYERDYSSPEEWAEVMGVIERGRDAGPWVKVERPAPMDVVLLKLNGFVCHVGLAIGGGWMLHCLAPLGTCSERLNGVRWSKRLHGFYRHRSRCSE